jgi:two-component system chemotaxis response regulator CheY
VSSARNTVLVVDDSPSMRQLLAFTLEDAGFLVATAGDGRAALELLASLGPLACVIADLNMPGMGGLELIGALRGKAGLREVPILVLTKDDQRRLEVMAAGATAYLVKPFAPEQLVGAVRTAVS